VKTTSHHRLLLATAVAIYVAGCATVPPGPPPEIVRLQNDLDRLHNDPRIADNAGTELANADAAVDVLARNVRTLDAREYEQGVFIADKLVGIAEASALARFEEQRGMQLGAEREHLMARTTTIDSSTTTVVTRVPQRVVRTDSGELVPRARAELMSMQDQMPGVESRLDARGLVIRLGDYMFEPGRAALTPTAEQSLDQVARVLSSDTDAGIAVEAFGSDGMSRERADSVRDYLDARGVDGGRIAARSVSYAPGGIASNDRRVDIVIRSDLR
jgi:outer membrane protein OmpA-like peptidoglycan-associated protein